MGSGSRMDADVPVRVFFPGRVRLSGKLHLGQEANKPAFRAYIPVIMKPTLTSLLLAAVISGSPAAFASGPAANRATATVELVSPEKFTDFKTSFMGTESDAQALGRELQRETNRLAGNILPAGYRVLLRISDIDMAGDFEPERGAPHDQIRIMRSVYIPRIALQYSVTDAAGNLVTSGERKLTQAGYEMRLRPMLREPLTIETDLLGDLFREIARTTS